jgi:hypothetical protein
MIFESKNMIIIMNILIILLLFYILGKSKWKCTENGCSYSIFGDSE